MNGKEFKTEIGEDTKAQILDNEPKAEIKIPKPTSKKESVKADLETEIGKTNARSSEGGNQGANDNPEIPPQTEPQKQNENSEKTETKSETQTGSQQQEKVKDGRGRHPKECNCAKCVTKRASKPNANAKTLFDDELSQYKKVNSTGSTQTTQEQPKPNDVTIQVSQFISGALFLIAVDSLLPSLLLKLMQQQDPKYKNVDAKKIKLTSEERKQLEPLADEVVKVIFGTMHPALAFLVAYGIITVGKLLILDDEDFEPKRLSKRK